MATPEIVVRDAARDAIEASSGTDLTDRVNIGRPSNLGEFTPPAVFVAIRSAEDIFGEDLAGYKTELLLDIYVYAPADSLSSEDREAAIVNLGFQVRKAVRGMDDPTGVTLFSAPLCGVAIVPEATQGTNLSVMVMQAKFTFSSEDT